MRIIFKKEIGRSFSNKASLKDFRGTLELDNGMQLHISQKDLRLTNVDFEQLEVVGRFTHLKPETITKRKVVHKERLVNHTIYSVEISGINLLFEQIDDEDILRTYKPSKEHGITIPDGTHVFLKQKVVEECNTLRKLLTEKQQVTYNLNKPKHLKTKKMLNIKLSKMPVELALLYK